MKSGKRGGRNEVGDLSMMDEKILVTGVGGPAGRGTVEYLHDEFSSKSNFSGETANVYMVSALYNMNRRTDIGACLKYIDLPTGSESIGSLLISYKTGLGF
jgi:hypothetical protein